MDVPDSLMRFRPVLDHALQERLQDLSLPLYEMMRYHLGWEGEALVLPGKYLRPALCLLTCEACGGDWTSALPGAVALEFLHNFSLIHDDIQDESPLRRGRLAVWQRWGTAQAINAGDGMYALSRLAALGLAQGGVPADRVLLAARLLDEACLALCEGQYLDLAYQERPGVTLADYEAMIARKTAAAFRCALEVGAILARGSGEQSDRLAAAGLEMGLAYQMRDDVLDLWGGQETGKETGLDVQRGKKSLPVVYGLSQGGRAEGRRLRDLYERPLTEDGVREVVSLLGALGAPAFCAGEAWRHWERARALLEGSGLSAEGLHALIEAGEFLLTRSY